MTTGTYLHDLVVASPPKQVAAIVKVCRPCSRFEEREPVLVGETSRPVELWHAQQPVGLGAETIAQGLTCQILDQRPDSQDRVQMALYEFARSIMDLPFVVAVTQQPEEGGIILRTFVTTREKEAREQIYARERDLMDACKVVDFDCYVICIEGREEEPLLPADTPGSILYYWDNLHAYNSRVSEKS